MDFIGDHILFLVVDPGVARVHHDYVADLSFG